jgi:D-Tyr-tRNAtyr deacylase
MRAVVQRVVSASVTGRWHETTNQSFVHPHALCFAPPVGDELVSSIGKGLLVLIGIGSG